MRLRLYLDTSVLGALSDPGPLERIQATRQFFDGLAQGLWEGFVSPLVLEEVSRAPDRVEELIARELQRCSPSVLEESQESVTLARAYVEAGAIPGQYEDDE